jgi:hypothetical protein
VEGSDSAAAYSDTDAFSVSGGFAIRFAGGVAVSVPELELTLELEPSGKFPDPLTPVDTNVIINRRAPLGTRTFKFRCKFKFK